MWKWIPTTWAASRGLLFHSTQILDSVHILYIGILVRCLWRQKIKREREPKQLQEDFFSFFFFRDREWKSGREYHSPMPVAAWLCAFVFVHKVVYFLGWFNMATTAFQHTVSIYIRLCVRGVCMAFSPGNTGESCLTSVSAEEGFICWL